MAILGILSIGVLFVLFSFAFVDLDEMMGKKRVRHPFKRDYFVIDSFSGEIQVTKKQEAIYNYLLASKHATFEQIEFACDCTKGDIDDMIYLGVVKLIKVETSNSNRTKSILFGVLAILLIGLVFYSANYYFLLVANIRYMGIIIYSSAFVIFGVVYFSKFIDLNNNKTIMITTTIGGIVVLILGFYAIFGGRTYFHSEQYSELIELTEFEFSSDVQTVNVETLPVVDKSYGAKLGSLKLGEYSGIGSEFEIGEYSDIIYNGEQYLVAPLEYRGIFKWFNNNDIGTPGYIMINKVTTETTLVNITDDSGRGMKYTPSAYFNQDIKRYAYYNGMAGYKLEDSYFEIDDSGEPYYILQYTLPTIFINGGKDISKIAVINAITGEIGIYSPHEVPEWVESVYAPELLLKQLNYWGSLQDGWINSIFGQRKVVQPSNGKRTIMNEGELYYFTGLTSAGSDESTIGFVYMNTRTKDTKLYNFPGATEQAAMNKVLTLLPQNNISTSFPIPINVNDIPTYFIAIKGEDGRILRYVFVKVQELEVYGMEETKAQAYSDYLLRLDSTNTTDLLSITDEIVGITDYVVDGTTVYWIELGNGEFYMIDVGAFDNQTMMYFISLNIGDEISVDVQGNTVIEIDTE